MITKIKSDITKWTKKYPQWKQVTSCFLADQDISSEDETVIDEFITIIMTICDAIKEEKCSIEEVTELFPEEFQADINKKLRNHLRPYFDCTVIRKNELTNRTQLEYFIDELWQQRIVRRNPSYQIDAEKCDKLSVSVEEIDKFTVTLTAIVDHCISRLYNFEAMVDILCDRTGISQEFSEYIARRIERDNETLRINFIIKNLTNLSIKR